jgi:putative ABC transport system ATP-binding protein
MPVFAVPCPLTILTIGLLLASDLRVTKILTVIPIVWSFIGGSAAFLFGIYGDLMLPAGAMAVMIAMIGKSSPETSPATSESSGDIVLRAEKLAKLYRMGQVEVPALNAVDLQLSRGEFVVLLGPSGSGKSTLLNILGGLDVPTSGSVHFFDHDLTSARDRDLTRFRREHVGFVFQFYNLIPSLTARENVELVTEIAEHPMDAEECLKLVGLQARMNHFPSELSGGEQQRVSIARAIAKRPDVLLCDEPTGALDVETGKLVLEVLENVNRVLRTTTVVITHNAAIASWPLGS